MAPGSVRANDTWCCGTRLFIVLCQ